jgi:hypothetical protein
VTSKGSRQKPQFVITALGPAIWYQMAGSSPAMTVLIVVRGQRPAHLQPAAHSLLSFRQKPESSFHLHHPKLDPDFRRGDEARSPPLS